MIFSLSAWFSLTQPNVKSQFVFLPQRTNRQKRTVKDSLSLRAAPHSLLSRWRFLWGCLQTFSPRGSAPLSGERLNWLEDMNWDMQRTLECTRRINYLLKRLSFASKFSNQSVKWPNGGTKLIDASQVTNQRPAVPEQHQVLFCRKKTPQGP